jgi:anti-sigma B factor antagonist
VLDPVPHPPLLTSITRPAPGTAVLAVSGEIDSLTAQPLEQAVRELLDDPSDDVLVVDLDEVTFLASSGLAVLIRGARRAASRDLRLRLVTGSRAVRRPLEVTGSDQLFDMYEDVSGAVDWSGARSGSKMTDHDR